MQTKSTANVYINGVAADATLKSLRAEAAKLRNELANLSPTSEEFAQKAEKFKSVQKRIEDVNGELKQTKGIFGQIQAEIGKFGMMAVAFLGFDAITGKVGNMIRKNAELSDSLADVMKTTGMTEAEVKRLNSAFGEFDTRTARSELLALARDAGKLGITGKKDVEEFVRAADKINVALGEDLGQDAITQIGKLVGLFKLKEQFGLEQSMLKVASAMNTLGASSEASEGYIVDFLKRMGGIAPIAGISIDQVMALGATLDSLGQTSEVSSTALSKMFTKMASDAATYARIAGISVEEFEKKMNENALSAFMLVLEAAGKTEGGLVQLTETLGDLGIEGGRATGLFGVLSKNLDVLSRQLDISKKSFEEGSSVIDEYNVKNNNLAANIEKLQKWLGGLFVNNAFLEGMKQLVNYAVQLINVPVSEHMERERLNLNKLELQLIDVNTTQKERISIIKELQNSYPEYFKHLDAEKATNDEIRKSIRLLNDEMINKIILQKEDERIQANNIKVAEKKETLFKKEDELKAQAIKMAERYNLKMVEGLTLYQQALGILSMIENKSSPLLNYASGRQQLAIALIDYKKALESVRNQEERGNLLLEEREALMKRLGIEKEDKQVLKNSTETSTSDEPKAPGLPTDKEQDEAYKKALEKLNQFYNTEKALVKLKMADDLENRSTHEAELLDIETRQLQARKDLLVQFNMDTSEIDLQMADNRIKLAEDEAKREAEAKKLAFDEIKDALAQEEALVHENYANQLITQEQYEMQLQELKIGSLEIMLAAYKAYGDDVVNIEKQIAEAKAKYEKLKQSYSFKTTLSQKELANELAKADTQLRVIQQENLTNLLATTRGFFGENTTLSKMALALTKAAAIAEIVVKAQLEKAAVRLTSLAVDPTGILGAARARLVDARMVASIAIIGAQAIKEVKGYDRGGFTGPGFGIPDKSGFKVAGVVHEDEYVVPRWMLRKPQYANIVQWLESERMTGGNSEGFAEGGMSRRRSRRANRYTSSGTRVTQRAAERAEIEGFEIGMQNDKRIISLIQETNDLLKSIEDRLNDGLAIGDDQIWKLKEREEKLTKSEQNARFS